MTTLTAPQARIAIGWANIAGQRVPVIIDPEWMRYLATLTERAGGTVGLSTTDTDAGSFAAMQPATSADSAWPDVAQCIDACSAQPGEALQLDVSAPSLADVAQPDTMQSSDIYPMQADCLQSINIYPTQ